VQGIPGRHKDRSNKREHKRFCIRSNIGVAVTDSDRLADSVQVSPVGRLHKSLSRVRLFEMLSCLELHKTGTFRLRADLKF